MAPSLLSALTLAHPNRRYSDLNTRPDHENL
jgi:hypothetical protein